MAKIYYRTYKNQNKKSNAYGKIYARLISQATLGTDDICRHIQKHGTIYTSDVVKGVVEKFINCFEELLLEGYKLKLDGLGTFYLAGRCEGAELEKDFDASNFKSVMVRFLADQSKKSEYTSRLMKNKASLASIKTLTEAGEEGGGSGVGGDDTTIEQP
jgi:predicted histone-like DNA-binding protein